MLLFYVDRLQNGCLIKIEEEFDRIFLDRKWEGMDLIFLSSR